MVLGLLSTRGNLRKVRRFCPYLAYCTTASLGLNCLFIHISHIFRSLVKGESTGKRYLPPFLCAGWDPRGVLREKSSCRAGACRVAT